MNTTKLLKTLKNGQEGVKKQNLKKEKVNKHFAEEIKSNKSQKKFLFLKYTELFTIRQIQYSWHKLRRRAAILFFTTFYFSTRLTNAQPPETGVLAKR